MNKLIFRYGLAVSGLCVLSCVAAKPISLISLAFKYKTDKGYAHDYMPVYEQYFNSRRDHELTILEIGFAEGNSARMWEEYFPKAELHFIDINKEAMQKGSLLLSHRSYTHLVDQSDARSLRQFAEHLGKKIDIIIDDGSHKNRDQILSFEALFPYVTSGGCYVIEDLHTSYWSLYGGGGDTLQPMALKSSAITFLLERVHDVNYYGARTGYADFNRCAQSLKNTFTGYQREIKSIHFYCSMCFVFKR
jgi:hypothetical protein